MGLYPIEVDISSWCEPAYSMVTELSTDPTIKSNEHILPTDLRC